MTVERVYIKTEDGREIFVGMAGEAVADVLLDAVRRTHDLRVENAALILEVERLRKLSERVA